MNPIRWLFRNDNLQKKEDELDDHLNRLREKVRESGSSMLIEIDTDFPKEFNELSEKITRGCVEWRDFYSNKILDIYSVHCRMDRGGALKEHRHPEYDEYIYVISGKIITWTDSDAEGKIITPAEKVNDDIDNVKSWYKIPRGINHRIQAIKKYTHFISKFIKPDV